MMTFWQYLLDNPGFLLACILFGLIFGVITQFNEGYTRVIERVGHIFVAILLWIFITYPAISWMDYGDYKKHYTTCEKPVAKRAGYVFAENRCWKPTNTYVKVNETTKTKQELLNDK